MVPLVSRIDSNFQHATRFSIFQLDICQVARFWLIAQLMTFFYGRNTNFRFASQFRIADAVKSEGRRLGL